MALSNRTFTPMILHFAPVLLGLHCLVLSLSGYSVFHGFSEDTPNTWISLSQMFIVLLLIIPPLRWPDISPGKRKMAFILTPIISLSILDEGLSWHEAIGRYIIEHNHILPRKLVHYSDDIIILFSALLGGIILYYCIKMIQEEESIQPYFLAILFIAIAHGELDILAHRHYAWQFIWPDLTAKAAYPMIEVLSFYEEICKVWTEWFVIIFLLRVYYNQKGYLLWSLQIFAATLIAPIGLWSVSLISKEIPYIIMGAELKFIRNYPIMIRLASIWLLWTSATWYYFKNNDLKRAISGLFFFSPFYLLLPQFTIGPIMNIENISLQHLIASVVLIFQTGGLLFPFVLFPLIKEHVKMKTRPILTTAFVVLFIGLTANSLWLLIIFGIVFLYWIRFSISDTMHLSWKPLVALHVLTVLIISYFFLPHSFLPNTKFKPAEKVLFQTGHQPQKDQPMNTWGRK